MKCPFCHNEKTHVKTCGNGEQGYNRRRICPKCHRQFSTVEEYTGIHSEKFKRHRRSIATMPNCKTTSQNVGIC